MKQTDRTKLSISECSRQRGQASAEYLVVATALIAVIVLAAGEDVTPIAALISALKSFSSAYSFTLSLP